MVLPRGSGTILGLLHRHVPLSLNTLHNADAIAKRLGIGARQSIERGEPIAGPVVRERGHRLAGTRVLRCPPTRFVGLGTTPALEGPMYGLEAVAPVLFGLTLLAGWQVSTV